MKKLTLNKNHATRLITSQIMNAQPHNKFVSVVRLRPCYTSGSGRFTSNIDHTDSVRMELTRLRIEYTEGNDAPRGGKTGQYIDIKNTVRTRKFFPFLSKQQVESNIKIAEVIEKANQLAVEQENEKFNALVSSIIIDDQFKTELVEAKNYISVEKSNRQAAALTSLLLRNNITVFDNSEFWHLFRVLKNK